MTFDPEMFGHAMGEEIRKAVEPLQREIADLKRQLSERPDYSQEIADAVSAAVSAIPAPKDGQDGKDCDMEAVKEMIAEQVKLIPTPKDGVDGKNGADGKDGTDGKDVDMDLVQKMIADSVAEIPRPADGKDGVDGKDGRDGIDGKPGEKGADGLGLAGAMIDRAGELQITLTNGDVKSLGPVVGKDGQNGKDGVDGVSLDAFEMEYIADRHEIAIKAVAGARVKEVRYPAGGLRPGGYWREGVKAKAGEAWVHDGCTWIAMKDTGTKPASKDESWIIAARKGRDGEDGKAPPSNSPVNLKG